MLHTRADTRRRRTIVMLCGALCVCASAASPALASADSVSSNWAGYVAVPASAGKGFKTVSGSWIQPAVTCKAGEESFSAAWVGLGGYNNSSAALEQIGTEADCSHSGRARYTTWYELIPAGPVALKLAVHPGDAVGASVTVIGHAITLRLRDTTTGARYSVTRHATAVDTSSAEWILEAPSSCFSESACSTLPLSNFGTVSFASATATLATHTGGPDDTAWSHVALEMREGAPAPGFGRRHRGRVRTGAPLRTAVPSALTSPLGAFSVSWQEQQPESEEPPFPRERPGS